MSKIISVIGATGKVGSAVTGHLLKSDCKVKAVARNKEKLEKLKEKGAEIFQGDIENTAFLTEVLKDSDAAFVMLPPCYHLSNFREVFNKMAESITDAIKISGIPHVVILSSVGADLPSGTGQISSLYEFESLLKALPGLSTVTLRCAFFMENHLNSIPLIKNAGINGSIIEADSAFGMIAVKDIAEAAAEYLQDLSFNGFNVRYLLGPCDYSLREATSILGASINKPDLMYVEFSSDEFINGMVGAGFSHEAAEALAEGFTALDKGLLTKDITRSSFNTTPTTLESFAQEVFAPAYNQMMN